MVRAYASITGKKKLNKKNCIQVLNLAAISASSGVFRRLLRVCGCCRFHLNFWFVPLIICQEAVTRIRRRALTLEKKVNLAFIAACEQYKILTSAKLE